MVKFNRKLNKKEVGMRKYLSVMLVLLLAFSFALPFASKTNVAMAQEGARVKIMMPADGSTFNVDDEFYVNAVITNPTDNDLSGNAVIDPGETVALVEGEVAEKSVTVAAHGTYDVWWRVKCTGGGDSTITVTFGDASDSVTVHQVSPTTEKIKVTIIEAVGVENPPNPPTVTATIEPCTDFVIKAKIENTSGVDLTNVSATIIIDGNASLTNGDPETWNLGTVYAGDTHIVSWNLHCDDLGYVDITVTASADNITEEEVTEDAVRIDQGQPTPPPGDLDLTLEAPEKVCTNCGENLFEVKATICNNTGDTVHNVNGTIEITAGSDRAVITGDTEITVNDFVIYDPSSLLSDGDPLSDDDNIKFYDVNGNGHWDENETVVYDGGTTTDKYDTSDTVIYDPNSVLTGGEDLLDDPLILYYDEDLGGTWDNTSGKEDPVVYNLVSTGDPTTEEYDNDGALEDGECATIIWDIQCVADGDVQFKVTVESDDTNPQYDYITVEQTSVKVLITDPTDDEVYKTISDKFDVTATVKNCTCIPYDHVTVIPLANGDVIPNADNVEFDPDDLNVHVRQYNADGELVAEFDIPINDENPNGEFTITSLCDCCEYEFTWHFHCTDESVDEIKVLAFQGDFGATYTELDSDSFTLHQGGPPKLTKIIEFFPGWYSDNTLRITPGKGIVPREEYAVSQNWTAVIIVSNIGGREARNVQLTLGADGDFDPFAGSGNLEHATLVYKNGKVSPPSDLDFEGTNTVDFDLGDIEAGESVKIIIEAHCSGPDDVTFYVPSDKQLSDDDNIKFYDVNGNGHWDENEPVVYDNGNTTDEYDTSDTVIYDPNSVLTGGEGLSDDPLILYYDEDLGGTWDNTSGEEDPVVYDNGLINGYYDTHDTVIYDPSGKLRGGGLTGIDPVTKEQIPDEDIYNVPNEDTIIQIPLDIDFINPTEGEEFDMSTKFSVKVRITNNDRDEDLTEVAVTLKWDGDIELWQGSQQTKVITSIPKEGGVREVSWMVHCTGPGEVKFWVEVAPGNTDLFIDEFDFESETFSYRTITQNPETTLEVTILSPLNNSYYATGQKFAVTAKVENTGDKVATSVIASFFGDGIVVDESSEIPEDVVIGDMNPGDYVVLTWTVRCVHANDLGAPDLIEIYAEGTNTDFAWADLDIWQYPAAYLKVEITEYPEEPIEVCSEFHVKGRVWNIGYADATDVKVTLNVSPEGSVRPVAGDNGYEIYLGTIPGTHGLIEEQYKEFDFYLHCKVVCESTLTIVPSGKDEYGFSAHVEDNILLTGSEDWHDWWNFNLFYPLSPIPSEGQGDCIEEDSVTVKQIEPQVTEYIRTTYPYDDSMFTTTSVIPVTWTVEGFSDAPDARIRVLFYNGDTWTIVAGDLPVESGSYDLDLSGFEIVDPLRCRVRVGVYTPSSPGSFGGPWYWNH